ncbi:hypothetical protein IID04_06015 [PVC group bacterium]|nr:hypothetical protein [PVC group bacterium]
MKWTKSHSCMVFLILFVGLSCGCRPQDSQVITVGLSESFRDVFEKGIIDAFQEHIKDEFQWRGLSIEGRVFRDSGELARAVIDGDAIEVAWFEDELSAYKVLMSPVKCTDWRKEAKGGTFISSPMVLARARGQVPEDVSDSTIWILDPQAFSSGRWGKAALFVREEFSPGVFPVSILKASEIDDIPDGDLVCCPEFFARLRGWSYRLMVPTLMAEYKLLQIHGNIKPQERGAVEYFCEFLVSDRARAEFIKWGFRPDDRADLMEYDYPLLTHPVTMADYGGWLKIEREILRK